MYLLLLSSNQIFPFLDRLSEVNGVHGDLDLADVVMFTKTVKVENLEHQSLTAQLSVGNLQRTEFTEVKSEKLNSESGFKYR